MAESNTVKAIYVGLPKIAEQIISYKKDYDFIATFNSPEEFLDAWEDSDKRIRDGKKPLFNVIVTDETFFDPEEEGDFEDMVILFSPHTLFLIICVGKYDEKQIRAAITSASNKTEGAEGNEEYFFISSRNVGTSINEATSTYINHHPGHINSYALEGIPRDEALELIEQERLAREEENRRRAEEERRKAAADNKTEVPEVEGKGEIVTVTSSKGGAGVTTVSLLLATFIAKSTEFAEQQKKGKAAKVCVVDMNLGNGQLGFTIGATSPSMVHMRSRGVNPEELKNSVIKVDKFGIDCIVQPREPHMADELTNEFIADLLNLLKREYDYIIVDANCNLSGNRVDLLERVVYKKSDLIVYVTDVDSRSMLLMGQWIVSSRSPRSKNGLGVPQEKIGVVVNNFTQNVGVTVEALSKMSLGLPLLTVTACNTVLFLRAANKQALQAVLLDENYQQAYRSLAESVVGDRFVLAEGFEKRIKV